MNSIKKCMLTLIAVLFSVHAVGQCDYSEMYSQVEALAPDATSIVLVSKTPGTIEERNIRINVPSTKVIFNHTRRHQGPCEVVVPPAECPNHSSTTANPSRESGMKWSFNSSVATDIGTSLVLKLIAKLDVSIGIGGELSGNTVEKIAFEVIFEGNQCFDKKVVIYQTDHSSSGELVKCSQKWLWHVTGPWGWDDELVTIRVNTRCDESRASGFHANYSATDEYTTRTHCCGDPDGDECCGCVVDN